MGLSDPFSQTYEGAYKANSALGEGLGSAFKNTGLLYADKKKTEDERKYQRGVVLEDRDYKQKELQKNQKMAFDTLKAAGMINEKVIPPTDDELKKGLEEGAKQAGISQVNWMESDDPVETRKSLENAYKTFGIPMPEGKKVIDYNLSPGTEYSPMKGDLEFKNPKSILSQFGLDKLPELDAYNQKLNQHGLEVAGYDQKGQPMVRKIKRDVSAEKFDTTQEEKKKASEERSVAVRDSAQETLNTLAEVEKGINHFGTFGNVPSIPGTERRTWEANIDKLLSGNIIDVMTKMKEASKTGATGFGQLSNKELEVLRQASTALKKDLPKEDAQKYLNRMKETMNKVIENKSSSQGNYSAGQVIEHNGKKYKILGGDPNDPDVEEIQ